MTCRSLAGVVQCVLSERHGMIEQLIDEYKFCYRRETADVLTRLLHEHALELPSAATIVPIPTASAHIRLRGFDHTHDIGRALAKRRQVPYARLLQRLHNKAQVGANRAQRRQQAEGAFACATKNLDADMTYVVCDDIVTTGASVVAAVSRLREAGATRFMVLALTQQPWNK